MNNDSKFAVFYVTMIPVASATSLYANSFAGSSSTLVLEWSPQQQEIVDGTFRIELAFEWTNETLDITAKINDDEYHFDDYLGLAFFRVNESGEVVFSSFYLCRSYLLLASNYTAKDSTIKSGGKKVDWRWHPGQVEELGKIVNTLNCWPFRNPYHNCTFTEGIGYTFNISIPKNSLANVTADVVYVVFSDVTHKPPYCTDWVSGRVWGWR